MLKISQQVQCMFRDHIIITNVQVSELRCSAGDDSKYCTQRSRLERFSISKGFSSSVNLQPELTGSSVCTVMHTSQRRGSTG